MDLIFITPEPIPFIEMEEGGWVYVPNAGAYVNPGTMNTNLFQLQMYTKYDSVYTYMFYHANKKHF